MLIAGDWAAELWLAAGISSSTISIVVIFFTGACLLWRGIAHRAATGTPDACSLCSVIFTDASEEPDWWEPTTIMWYKPACCNKWVCDSCIYGVDQDLLADHRFCKVCVTGSWYRHLRTPRCFVLGSNTLRAQPIATTSDDKPSAVTSALTPPARRSALRQATSPANKRPVHSSSIHQKFK